MRLPIFQVDAFTTQRFSGNPAAVVLFEQYPADSVMQNIAAENNLAETAFLVPDDKDNYHLRWFTPTVEVPLCGHATLASAAVVMERLQPDRHQVVFNSASGPLTVTKSFNKDIDRNTYALDFPARFSEKIPASEMLITALGVKPIDVVQNQFNYMAILENAKIVRELKPDMALISKLDRSGVIVTAVGDKHYDFVSRYFAPAKGIPEDPVTGAAHCMLTPYWANKLNKTEFFAYQASARGGELKCTLKGDRVVMQGHCAFYLEGHITL